MRIPGIACVIVRSPLRLAELTARGVGFDNRGSAPGGASEGPVVRFGILDPEGNIVQISQE